jgi:hypothetical protein
VYKLIVMLGIHHVLSKEKSYSTPRNLQ